MSLIEIEKTIIEPLTIEEKQQLIKDVQRMIENELKREAFAARFNTGEELYISPGFDIDPEAALKLHGRNLSQS